MIAKVVLSAALLFVAAAPSAAVTAVRPETPSCKRSHVARAGDSWWSIAERHRLPLARVLRLNAASLNSMILVGDRVCLQRANAAQGGQPTTTTTEPARTYTRREVIDIIREVWPDDLEERALQIAERESRFNPKAVGGTRNCCYGLFQIYYRWHTGWLAEMGVTDPNQLLDPRTSAEAALRLYRRNGWGPWE